MKVTLFYHLYGNGMESLLNDTLTRAGQVKWMEVQIAC